MRIEVDGFSVNMHISGPPAAEARGNAVILQGWGTDFRSYDFVARCISDNGYRTVQLDLPGFGGTAEPEEAWDVGQYSDFFGRFVDRLFEEGELSETGGRKVLLIGHSYGGRMIIKLAATKESTLSFEIERIILIDSAGILPVRTKKQKRAVIGFKFLKRLFSVPFIRFFAPDVIDEWLKNQGSADYRNASPIMKKAMVMAINEDLSPLLPDVKEDVLLVWGDKDTATPLSDGEKMKAGMPHAELAVIEGTGHYCFGEKPAVFRGIIDSWLGGQTS